MTFAESEFCLAEPQSDGNPLRAHLESIYRQTGEEPEQLATAPKLPALLAYLWQIYVELCDGSAPGQRFTFDTFSQWMRFSKFELAEWEIRTLRACNALWLRKCDERRRSDAGLSD